VAKDWRTLKLEVLAETTQFVKGMDKANATTKSFGDKLGDFAKKAGIALAAVGAAAGLMAIKIGKEAVAAASDLAETVSKVRCNLWRYRYRILKLLERRQQLH
jgi:hypothetical protein